MAGYIDGKVDIWYGVNPPLNNNILWMQRSQPYNFEPSSLYEFNNQTQEWVLFTKVYSPVEDNLNSTDGFASLSANQGRVLNISKVDVPAVAVDGELVTFDGTTGRVITSGGLTPAELQLIANKVTAWSTPLDTQYPSAKLVKDSLDGKISNATHTGDVTGSAELSITNKAVTLPKLADVATQTFLGRKTAATGTPEVLSIADAKSLIHAPITLTNSDWSDLDRVDLLTGHYPLIADLTQYGGSLFVTVVDISPTEQFIYQQILADHTVYSGNEIYTRRIDYVIGNTPTYPPFESVVNARTVGYSISVADDATPTDTDYVATSNNSLQKITWANVKAFLKTYFDTVYILVTDKFKLTSDRTGYFNTVSGTTNADFTSYDICKYRLTAAGGVTASYVNTFSPGQDMCKTIVIRNDYASTITITIPTSITGGEVTFTLVNMKATTTVDIPAGKQLEISYLFEYTEATVATVSISYFLQG